MSDDADVFDALRYAFHAELTCKHPSLMVPLGSDVQNVQLSNDVGSIIHYRGERPQPVGSFMGRSDTFTGVNKEILFSFPVKVNMAGFVSDTLKLQANGWQISVEAHHLMSYDAMELRVAFKHDGIKQVAMGICTFTGDHIMSTIGNPSAMIDWWRAAGIEINYIAPMIQVQVIPWRGIAPQFMPIDARPEWGMSTMKSLDQLAVFKPIKSENFEIYINQKDEQEILDMLLAKQDSRQKEIRQNQKRREYMKSDAGIYMPDTSDKINTDVRHQLVVVSS